MNTSLLDANAGVLMTCGISHNSNVMKVAEQLTKRNIRIFQCLGAGAWGYVFSMTHGRVVKISVRKDPEPFDLAGQNDFTMARAIISNGGTLCLPQFYDAWKLPGMAFAVREDIPDIPASKFDLFDKWAHANHTVDGRSNTYWTGKLARGPHDDAEMILRAHTLEAEDPELRKHLYDAIELVRWCKYFGIYITDIAQLNCGYRRSTNSFVIRDLSNSRLTSGVKLR